MAVPIVMPKLGLSMETGTVVAWRVHEGDKVRKGDVLLEVETDKITTDVESPEDGTVLKLLVEAGTEAKVKAVLAVLGAPGEDISQFLAAPESGSEPSARVQAGGPAAESSEAPVGDKVRITPRAKKMLVDAGFSAADLAGLNKARITEADVQAFIATKAGAPAGASAGGAEPGGTTRAMSRVEKVVAQRMTESFRDIPQFSVRFSVDADRFADLRTGGTVSVNDIVLRAVAIALVRFPDVQCQYRPEGIFSPGQVNLGFAVAVGKELVVPVIRNADKKNIRVIAEEAASLQARAKEHKLLPDDLAGGTFTVSNLGMFGITSFTPIVNPGEGAILGVGAVQDVARVRDGSLGKGAAVELTLVCDHRSVNGATAAGFCKVLKGVFESEERGSW